MILVEKHDQHDIHMQLSDSGPPEKGRVYGCEEWLVLVHASCDRQHW